METFDSTGDNADTDTSAVKTAAAKELPASATLGADDFISRAMADPAIVQFLGMRITATPGTATSVRERGGSECLTLRETLRELVVGRGKRSRSKARQQFDTPPRLRWADVDGLLFEPHDPTEVFGNPSSTVSVTGDEGAGEQGEEVRGSSAGGLRRFSGWLLQLYQAGSHAVYMALELSNMGHLLELMNFGLLANLLVCCLRLQKKTPRLPEFLVRRGGKLAKTSIS